MKKAEVVSIKPQIIELNQTSNDIYMLMTMCILTNQVNLNNLQFTEDYIDGIVNNKDIFIGIPLQVNRSKLENGYYKYLTHEFDKKTGLLKTDTIGSFVDFWKDIDEDGTIKLMGSVKIYKRYPHVCSAIIELYESGDLEFSCEVLVYGYAEIDEETNVRKLNYEYEGNVNSLIGSCIVTYAAEPRSKAELLIAEAISKDLEGGTDVEKSNQSQVESQEEKFNKGHEIQYHGYLETSALTSSDIANQIYNIVNPINPQNNYRQLNYWITDVYFTKAIEGFDGYVIMEDWDDFKVLWRANFRIENDIVILDDKANWIEGYRGFIPKGVNIDDLLTERDSLSVEINQIKSQHEEDIKKMEKSLEELQQELNEKEEKIKELNGTIVSLQEKIKEMEENATKLIEQIQELQSYKEKVELAEKQAKQQELREKYSKLLSEEAQKSEEFAKAIEELSEAKLNEMVVKEVAEKLKQQSEEKKEPDIFVFAKKNDLLPQSRRERLYAEREE